MGGGLFRKNPAQGWLVTVSENPLGDRVRRLVRSGVLNRDVPAADVTSEAAGLCGVDGMLSPQ